MYTGLAAAFNDWTVLDLFFVLFGELHKDPFRFLSEDEIHSCMGDILGFRLSEAQRQRFTVASNFWKTQRVRNQQLSESGAGACTFDSEPMTVLVRSDFNAMIRRVKQRTFSRILSLEFKNMRLLLWIRWPLC